MAKCVLFDSYTWKIPLPAPFDDTSRSNLSDTHISRYNYGPGSPKSSGKESTLHAPILYALLSYAKLYLAQQNGSDMTGLGATGTQSKFYLSESYSNTGEIQCVRFNRTNGKFSASRFEDPNDTPTEYVVKENGNTGAALLFALIPIAMEDEEFSSYCSAFIDDVENGHKDLDATFNLGYVLCDNLYRRIENAASLGDAGINVSIPGNGKIPRITEASIKGGVYAPENVSLGKFVILGNSASKPKKPTITAQSDFVGKYMLSDRTLNADEQKLVPALPDWHIISPEAVSICKHAKLTTGTNNEMRNFLLRGPAGTGKTETARAIAAGLGLPYVHQTCSANHEIFDFIDQMLPDVSQNQSSYWLSVQEIEADPVGAYFNLFQEYQEDVTALEVYRKMMETYGKSDIEPGTKFKYVDTPLMNAIRYGWPCEVQEPTVIANPGVLVGLNSLLDGCGAISLPTGEIVHRHPDCVIVVTTNSDYEGCRQLNQSFISRMSLIHDVQKISIDTMCERAMKITNCTDTALVRKMAGIVANIADHCHDTGITDGVCGMRQLIDWIQSYMIDNDLLASAECTVLAAASADLDSREDIRDTCLSTVLDAA